MWSLSRFRNDVIAVALLAATLFTGLALVSVGAREPAAQLIDPPAASTSNWCGPTGAVVAVQLLQTLGWGAYAVVVGLGLTTARLFTQPNRGEYLLRTIGWVVVIVAASLGCALVPLPAPAVSIAGPGGTLGAQLSLRLLEDFRWVGCLAIAAAGCLAGLTLADELRIFRWLIQIALFPITMWSRVGLPTATPGADELGGDGAAIAAELKRSETEPDAPLLPESLPVRSGRADARTGVRTMPLAADSEPAAAVAVKPRIIKVNPPITLSRATSVSRAAAQSANFELPDVEVLEDGEAFPYEELAKKAQVAAATLERAFQQFGLNVKVVEIDTGPVITQFELELEAGLRLNKVAALADDLAIALRVPSVRVVAPIPGKNTVGIEVPNDLRVMVRLKELIQANPKAMDDKRIPLFLGKDVSGHPLVVDLCKMPHLLIAGRTGTGKSVCLNTLILSILMSRSPDQVRMLMIDPKMVELSPYTRIPHLMHPVITDMKKAEAVLGWAVDQMEERYDLLARVGVRHLDSYNQLGRDKVLERLEIDPDSEEADGIPARMPYIVIIADEMADMMMTSGKEVEGFIIRLAQKSRAVGIHLVLATQKPTVDVITGLIKSNLPSRIAFQVASRMDSRVVLDEMGADKLLGNGDMLYLAPGTSNLFRAQGTYVSDDEVNRIIEFYSDHPPAYDPELMSLKAAKSDGKAGASNAAERERDDLYDQAVEVIIREGRGSVSLLQRALGVGYGRGARMIDWMAEDGVVGTYNGSQAREVLMTLDDWEEIKMARGG